MKSFFALNKYGNDVIANDIFYFKLCPEYIPPLEYGPGTEHGVCDLQVPPGCVSKQVGYWGHDTNRRRPHG